MKRIRLVEGALLLLLLLIGRKCLLKRWRLITIWRQRGLWIGLIAVLLLICGFRLLTLCVWMDFIIRICAVISIRQRRLHIVSRTAARTHHPFVVVLAVVGLVCVIGRRNLLSINWIIAEVDVFTARTLLNLVRFAQARIFCWIRHSKIATSRTARLVRLHTDHVSAIRSNN